MSFPVTLGDPWYHKGHPNFQSQAVRAASVPGVGQQRAREMGMGDRDGSAGIGLQQPPNPRCSKGKDLLRKQLKGKLPNPEG